MFGYVFMNRFLKGHLNYKVNKVKQILFSSSLFEISSVANFVIWFEKKYV